MHPARAYVLYVFLSMMSISTIFVVYTLFAFRIGLSVSDIVLINMAFQGTILVAEIPTGMLADRRGRLWSLRIGTGIALCSVIFYSFASDLYSALIAEMLLGISAAFASGAESAWITDALAKRGEKERLKRVFADAMIARKVAVLIGSGMGTFVWTLNFRATWILSACCFGGTLLFTILCMKAQEGECAHRIPERAALVASLRLLQRSYSLQWLIATLVLFGFALPFNHLWTPIFEPQVGIGGLYLLNAFMQGAMLVGAFIVRHIANRELSERNDFSDHMGNETFLIVFAFALIGLSLAGLGLESSFPYALMGIFVHECGRGMQGPLCQAFMQQRVESSHRATYGSLESFIVQIGWSIIYATLWFLLPFGENGRDIISRVWVISGGLLSFFIFVLWLVRPRRT